MAEPDYDSMSNEELMAIAGVNPSIDIQGVGPGMPTPTSDPYDSLSNEELIKIAGVETPREKGWGEKFSDSIEPFRGFSRNFNAGVTLGLNDEIEGVAAGLANYLFGTGKGYDEQLKIARESKAKFANENPLFAMFANIIGGTALPANIFGKANSVKNLAKEGAAIGGLFGFNEGEGGLENRLTSGAVGTAVGGVGAPIVGKAVEYGTGALGDFLARNKINIGDSLSIGGNVASERGSISGNTAIPGYTPEELYLAKQLKNVPLDKVSAGNIELQNALKNDVPLFLPEAVGSAKVDRNARFIANKDASMDLAQSAISSRAESAPERASTLLNELSTASPFEGATKMTGAADDIIKAAEKIRKQNAAPLYKEAFDTVPEISSPEFGELLQKDQVLKSAINSVRKTANNADLPLNSAELLVKARSEIGDQIESAMNRGEARKARDLTDTYNRLNEILHKENPLLKIADQTYQADSGGIDELTSTFLSSLRNVSEDKIQNIGQVFNLPAERITALKDTFKKSGKSEEWNAGIRSYMQTAIEGTKDGRNFTDKLIGNTVQRKKLEAALGPDLFKKIESGLSYENRMFQGRNKYNPGSSTAGNLAEEASYSKDIGTISKFLSGDWKGAISGIFQSDMPDELAQAMAEIYFNPKKGSETLKNILPLLEQYSKNKVLSEGAGKIGALATGQQSGNITRPDTPAKEQSFLTPFISISDASATQYNPTQPDLTSLLGKVTGNMEDVKTPIVEEAPEFGAKVDKIAQDLGADPEHLLAVMNFETGGKLSSDVKNAAGSGATGLIQFMPSTAKELTGAKTKEAAIKILENMTPVEQLDYVKKYLEPFKGKLKTLEDMYMAVLYPKAVGKDSEYALFKEGTKAYWQNRGLDLNDDGIITKSEAADKVKSYNV